MRIFVAGATGVLGIPVVERLTDAGHEVTGVARTAEKAAQLRALGATPVTVDLFDAPAVEAAVAGHDAVVNLATSIPPPSKAGKAVSWETNNRLRAEASGVLVDAAIAAGARVFVQESIAFLYEDAGDRPLAEEAPLADTVWTEAVRAAEANAARFTAATAADGGRGIVLRFGGFFGEAGEHTQLLLKAAQRGVSLDIGRHDAYFPVIDVEDAADAVLAALAGEASGVFNVVNDFPLTRRQSTTVWSQVLGRKVRRLPAALSVAAGVAAPSTKRSMRVSNLAFKAATGWTPRHPSLRDTLQRVVGGPRSPQRPGPAVRAGLTMLMLVGLSGGVWAQFFPQHFHDSFPFGRGWVAADGPFNEHLLRDYGGLNLALAVMTWGALRSRRVTDAAIAGVAWLAFAVPHFVYHLNHLHLYQGIDVTGNAAGTALLVLLALGVAAGARPRPRRTITVPA